MSDFDRLQSAEKRLHATIKRDFFASLMNNTKWKETIDSLQGLPISYRVKFVDEDESIELSHIWSATRKWLDSVKAGPFLPASIEWLEILAIAPKSDERLLTTTQIGCLEEVGRRLKSNGIDFFHEDDSLRILGYIRQKGNRTLI